MANGKQILSILPDYIPPLAGNKIPQDYEYTLFTTYIPKGIRVVGSQLGQISLLKNNEFNLGDRKDWHSPLLNVMNIPHFGRHQEVNTCVKLLLSCYHGGYQWLDWRITVDLALIHQITGLSMKGPDPQQFYPGKASDRSLAQHIKEAYDEVEKGK
jgi:hypothetical protein